MGYDDEEQGLKEDLDMSFNPESVSASMKIPSEATPQEFAQYNNFSNQSFFNFKELKGKVVADRMPADVLIDKIKFNCASEEQK